MKETTTKKQKRLYLILLICTALAVVAAVTLSLVFGLGGNNIPDPDPGPGIEQPGGEDPNNPGGEDPNNPGGEDPNNPGGEDPNAGTDPELVYEMPVSDYQKGMQCVIDDMVWSTTLKWFETHNGTDFLAAKGTPVKAVYDGTVTAAGYAINDGYYVTIKQDDGITSVYLSLTADITVEPGDVVKAGTIIGAVGDSMTSEQNEGYHLHLEMLDENGDYIDPMSKLPADDK